LKTKGENKVVELEACSGQKFREPNVISKEPINATPNKAVKMNDFPVKKLLLFLMQTKFFQKLQNQSRRALETLPFSRSFLPFS